MSSLLLIIVLIVSLDFLVERGLDFLNYRYLRTTLPAELAGIYNHDQYEKSQEYSRSTARFSMVVATFSFLLLLVMLLGHGFALVDDWARDLSDSELVVSLLFFAILFFAADIINLPFSLYSTFVIEERFGFNKMTLTLFWADKLKGWFLTMVLGGGLLSLIIWFYQMAGPRFWLWAWLAISAFTIFMAMFYSSLIVPLFNKQTPLAEGELRCAIEEFAQRAGFVLDNIFVIDGSKRSSKANAYFSGLGPKKRIVLYDTLIADLTVSELVAVLAHEIGHYQKRHIIKGLILGICQSGVMLYIFSLVVGSAALSQALGGNQPSFHLALVGFAILYSPISMVLGLVMNIFSRRNEYEADAFAAGFGLASALAEGLKKLSRNNLANLTPHPAYVFFHYSHPPLLQRLKALAV